jgi:hypothetical protein
MPQKKFSLPVIIIFLVVLLVFVAGAIYVINFQRKINEETELTMKVYKEILNGSLNTNNDIHYGVGEVALSIKFNSRKCETPDVYAIFDVLANSQPVGEVKVPNCLSNEGEVLAQTKDNIYFTILPNGLGGYILYGEYMNLYDYEIATSKITQLLNLTNLSDFDFTTDRGKLVYLKALNKPIESQPIKYALVIRDLTSEVETSFDLPETYSQYGDFKFSPDGNWVAFATAIGPDNPKGAVYKIDITNTSNIPALINEQANKVFQVTGWKNNEEVIYE